MDRVVQFNAAELDNFLVCWAKLDPYASQFITLAQMEELLRELDAPRGGGHESLLGDGVGSAFGVLGFWRFTSCLIRTPIGHLREECET